LDRDTVWRALAERRDGAIVTNWRNRVKSVSFPADPWSLRLDSSTEPDGESLHTRVRALFPVRDGFRLRMHRRSILSPLGDWLGRRRVQVSHPEIEAQWIVKSSSEGRAQSLLMLPAVVDGVRAIRTGTVSVERYRNRRAQPGTHAVTIAMAGMVKDPARLEGALDLCTAILEQLVRMGCANRQRVQAGQP
jgi:hypothetical protein